MGGRLSVTAPPVTGAYLGDLRRGNRHMTSDVVSKASRHSAGRLSGREAGPPWSSSGRVWLGSPARCAGG